MFKLLNKPIKLLHQLSKTNQELSRLSSSFKAAVIEKVGEPLTIIERKPEKLKPKEVRLQVAYCSVNSVDCLKFKNTKESDLPFTPGYELSGEVIEVGKEVSKEQAIVGDRVVGLSLESFGGLSQQCVINSDNVWRIPNELGRKDAAVIAYGHSTALYTFAKLCTIKEKEKVIVSVGPAGLGLAAVDVAANIYNAQVLGVVDTEELGELVRNRGAFETVHFSSKLEKAISKVTDSKLAGIVYDAVGEHMLKPISNCVKFGGKVFHAAPVFYETLPAPVPHTFQTIVSLKILRQQNLNLYKTVVSDTLEMANEGVISAHISANFQLKDVNKALEFIEKKKCTGKVLITLDE